MCNALNTCASTQPRCPAFSSRWISIDQQSIHQNAFCFAGFAGMFNDSQIQIIWSCLGDSILLIEDDLPVRAIAGSVTIDLCC